MDAPPASAWRSPTSRPCVAPSCSLRTSTSRRPSSRSRPPPAHREMRAIRAQSRSKVDAIRDVIRWPITPNNAWRKGFLAGIFDAEGSCEPAGALRVSNCDGTLIHWTQESLDRFGFDTVVERPRRQNRPAVRPDPRRPQGAAAVLPPHGPGDHAEAEHRGGRAQVGRQDEGRLGRAARHGAAALRHHDRHGRLHRRRRREPQLLRTAHARVPGPQRGRGLRARDHRQGQRAGGAAGGARAAVVEGRGGGAGHEHGPVPVGRGPLQADARHLGGDEGRGEPVLDPHQVAARAARSGPAEADRGGRRGERVPVGADARREGVARDRAAHPEPARAAGGRGGAQPRRHPDRDPDRAADARDQRRAGAGRADRRAGDGGGRRLHRRQHAVPARVRAGHLLRLAP